MVPAAARLQEAYASIRVPVAIIAGSADEVADAGRQSSRLHHNIAGSKLQVLPQVGHMAHYADPDAVVRAVDNITTGRIYNFIGVRV